MFRSCLEQRKAPFGKVGPESCWRICLPRRRLANHGIVGRVQQPCSFILVNCVHAVDDVAAHSLVGQVALLIVGQFEDLV
ncbi:MAG: hypothetical protein JWM16_4581, partial [Verrucomicrobiales bacterium]|nr:hypothetical protein [Verrucomicrobiales bacterium]